jgi:enediyne biosynthesis protein E4
VDSSRTYRQKTLLYHNKGDEHLMFENISAFAGPAFEIPIVGRGVATGDFDNDGRVDVLIVDSEGKPLLLHNQTHSTENWAGVRLQGTESNRDGQGALLTAKIAGQKFVRLCTGGGSYLSASDKRVHFGLGKATQIDSLTIQWPNGKLEVFKNIAANRYITITQGKSDYKRAPR